MHRFKNLKVWQKSMKLSVEIYKITNKFPAEEKYGLTSQIRRAAVSIISNIAEGSSRASNKDFTRFLSISLGSSFEVEAQLLLAIELGLFSNEDCSVILNELSDLQAMIIGLQNRLEQNNVVNEDEVEYLTPSKI